MMMLSVGRLVQPRLRSAVLSALPVTIDIGFSSWRTLSTKSEPETTSSDSGYLASKRAAKERRRQLYESRQERKERVKVRRQGKPRDQKRKQFRSWFIKKKVDEEYMNRKARQAGLDWKINVAVLLERYNVVQPDQEEWETEYENLKAYLSQFGKIYPKELVGDVDYEQLALTDEELLAMLPKGFVPAPRETEADATGNVRTTDRKLKTYLYLTVKDGDTWQMPTVALKENETLLEAAKRGVAETVGTQVEFWCLSNCPCAVDMVAFPQEGRTNGYYGTKTFFMKVQYDEGDVSERDMTVQDFAWLDRHEIVERVQKDRGDYEAKFYQYLLIS